MASGLNKRRKLLLAIGAGGLVPPLRALAQPAGKVWRVGFLASSVRPADLDAHAFGGLVRGLRVLGYVEGRNLALEWRFADGQRERLAGLAEELVRLKVDVIVTSASSASRAAQRATSEIPVVFAAVDDPVGLGLVTSLARPGRNITGRANITHDLGPKRLELLLAVAPQKSRIAVLVDANSAAQVHVAESLQAAGRLRRVAVVRADVATPQDIDAAFAALARDKVGALIVPFTPLFNQQRNQIASLAAQHRWPTIAGERGFVHAGCLMSYGARLADDFFQLAVYVDKIAKGARPSDLPVEQPTRFEWVINRKTAQALGLTLPAALMLQADEVID